MSDPLTALMHAVQVMNLLKTLILRTMREREDSEGTYSTFSSSSSLSDELDEVGREDQQDDDNDIGIEKYASDSSQSPKNMDKTVQLKMHSEQLIVSSRRHASFEFRLPYISSSNDDEDASRNDIEEGFLRRLEVSKGSNFFPSSKEAEHLNSSETISGSCKATMQAALS